MRKRFLLFGVIACLISANAWADAGLPMIVLTFPVSIIALIPVILIEAYIFKRGGFLFKWALKWNAISNIITTVIGVPLTWGILVALELLTVGGGCQESIAKLPQKIYGVVVRAPWLCPFNKELYWMIPTAYLILLVPFFFISWKIESLVVRNFNKDLDQIMLNKLCLRANITSYVLLALYPISLYFTL